MARVEVTPEFWVSPCGRVKRQSALDLPSARGKRISSSCHEISPLGNRLKGAGMEANELLRVQYEVTSERDPEKRRVAIERACAEDLRFLDSEADVMRREAFSDRVQQILDGAPPDFVIKEDAPLRDGRESVVRGLVANWGESACTLKTVGRSR
jgi:hypothetical protein